MDEATVELTPEEVERIEFLEVPCLKITIGPNDVLVLMVESRNPLRPDTIYRIREEAKSLFGVEKVVVLEDMKLGVVTMER